MRQLNGFDLTFLDREKAGVHGHICALQILDPSTAPNGELTTERVRKIITDRVAFTPLRGLRLTSDLPVFGNRYLVNGPPVDPADHVHEAFCDPPGDDRALARTIERIHSQPLDRSRPLWDWYVIHGLSGGRVAILVQTHHAYGDGFVQAQSLALLFDLSADGKSHLDGTEPPEWIVEEAPGVTEGLKALPTRPIRQIRSFLRAIKEIDQLPGLRGVPGAASIARALGKDDHWVPTKQTAFNGRIGHERSVAFFSLPLADVKEVKNAFGATVNDIIVAACAGGLRRRLLERGELPDEPLVAIIPVSTRQDTDPLEGNLLQFPVAPIPTDEADPAARVSRVVEATGKMKVRVSAMPRTSMEDGATGLPSRWAAAAQNLPGSKPTANVIISNPPFPPIPLYVGGAKLVSNHMISHLLEGVGLTIVASSSEGKMNFGICGYESMVPDVWELAENIRDDFDALKTLGMERTAPGVRPSDTPGG